MKLIRNIGVSNFNSQGLRDLMSFAQIKPSVLQVRIFLILTSQCNYNYDNAAGSASLFAKSNFTGICSKFR